MVWVHLVFKDDSYQKVTVMVSALNGYCKPLYNATFYRVVVRSAEKTLVKCLEHSIWLLTSEV